MIIFIDEDEAYHAWLADHPRGLVVNARRKPSPRYLVLHKASCAEVSGPRRQHTSGPYIKICAHGAHELVDWAVRDVGGRFAFACSANRTCRRLRVTLRRPLTSSRTSREWETASFRTCSS